MSHIMVHCAHCDAIVSANVRAVHMTSAFEASVQRTLPEARVWLAVCPSCQNAIVARSTWEGEDGNGSVWREIRRVWPHAERESHAALPPIVQVSLDEAHRCYRAAAYTASVVMAGRSLEAVCLHFKTGTANFSKALKELLERGLIDQRLWLWGDELRKHRNLAAHPSERKFSSADATDLLDFVTAICEYVFVLTPRFQSFMQRARAATAPDNTDSEGGARDETEKGFSQPESGENAREDVRSNSDIEADGQQT